MIYFFKYILIYILTKILKYKLINNWINIINLDYFINIYIYSRKLKYS